MTQRRNFHPGATDADYEHAHIKFRALIEVDLHNVGDEFGLGDAVTWLNEAIERGLKIADPNDAAKVVDGSEMLIARPRCACYAGDEQ